MNHTVQDFLANRGIVHDFAPVYGHEYNGLAERYNRTLLTMVWMMLLQIKEPISDRDHHSYVNDDSGMVDNVHNDADMLDTIHVQPSSSTAMITAALPASYNPMSCIAALPISYTSTASNATSSHDIDQDIMHLDKSLWAEACTTAVYIKNRLPHSALPHNVTPYEVFHGQKPDIGHMHLFGAICYVHIPVERRPSGSKLDPRAEKAIFLGYNDTVKLYRVQLSSSRHIRDVPASECNFPPYNTSPSTFNCPITPNRATSRPLSSNRADSHPTSSIRTTSCSISPNRTTSHQLSSNQTEGDELDTITLAPRLRQVTQPDSAAFITEAFDVPQSYEEVMSSTDRQRWWTAINDELQSMDEQHVWTIVPRPQRRPTVGSTWHWVASSPSRGT